MTAIHAGDDNSTPSAAGVNARSSTKQVPAGYTVHREASAEVLLAEGRDVFINPIQEFNRDLSSLTIRTWSELIDEEKRAAWERKKAKGSLNKCKKRKHGDDEAEGLSEPSAEPAEAIPATTEPVRICILPGTTTPMNYS
jgi:tRNA (guanine26-N2/guanine27-N2)-dimethyltransferase